MVKYLIIIVAVIGIPIWIISKIVEYFQGLNDQKNRENNRKEEVQNKYSKLVDKFGERNIEEGLSLENRNEDIIKAHLKKLSAGYQRSYYIENSVRDCIDDIASAEKNYKMAPGSSYLSDWSNKANEEYLGLKDVLLKRFRDKKELLDQRKLENEENKKKEKFDNLKDNYSDLIKQFFEIAERKVSIIDDYGDENWDELPKQIDLLIQKIAKKEKYTEEDFRDWKKYDFRIPEEFKLLKEKLKKDFKAYHSRKLNIVEEKVDFNEMSGIEFETFLSRKLKQLGYEVQGTPATGDQGADLIASKNGQKIVIQAKRYSGNVGNKAVQEIVGAISYYNADKGYVVTNSFYTASAKALAQKNNIKLIDGHDLKKIETYL